MVERDVQKNLNGLYKLADARTTLKRLVDRGADPKAIVKYLIAIHENRRKRPKDIGAIPGLPLDKIRKLPELCRQLARKIQAIDQHLYSVFVQVSHRPLLDGLRQRAFDISKRLEVRAGKKGKPIAPDTEWKVRLVGYVRSTTKKPRFQDICQLIRAFFSMNGGMAKCSPSSLKMLWSDHPEYRETLSPPYSFR